MNYNTLRNKPTINYKEIIGDNTVTDVGGITEEEFDDLLDTDLASYYTKAEIDDLFSRSFVYREKSGSIVTFDCPESTTSGISEVTSEIVAVQSGTGDPSPTNVRPFSGWSEVNVYDTGKNLCNFADKTITEGTYVINNAPMCLPTGSYLLSFDFSGTTNSSSFRIDDKNGNSIFSTNKVVTEGRNSVLISLSQTGFYVKYYSNAIGEYSNFQIEQGTTATTYEAFSGTTYTTTLKDSQGNPMECYGGELSNVNGVQSLGNGKVKRTLNGTENWVSWAAVTSSDFVGFALGGITEAKGGRLTVMCNQLKSIDGLLTDNNCYFVNNSFYVCISKAVIGGDTIADFKTYLASNNLEIIYELATPQTIPQDNLAIATQEGTNNLWADSGDITVKALDRIIQG